MKSVLKFTDMFELTTAYSRNVQIKHQCRKHVFVCLSRLFSSIWQAKRTRTQTRIRTRTWDSKCSGCVVVTAYNFECGSIYYNASITAQGLPDPSSILGNKLVTRAAEDEGCNYGMQIDWRLQSRAVLGHTFIRIIWHMPRIWSQFSCMTIPWWSCHEMVSVTFTSNHGHGNGHKHKHGHEHGHRRRHGHGQRQEHGIRHGHIQILVLDYETKGPKSIPNQST